MNQKEINRAITQGLEAALSGERRCEIVNGNINTPVPAYPYLSFTVTSSRIRRGGTHGRLASGVYDDQFKQVWRFTAQSDDDDEALRIADVAQLWFKLAGRLYLTDWGITVVHTGDVENRSSLVNNDNEHCYGFDIAICLTDIIQIEEPIIETARFTIDGRK